MFYVFTIFYKLFTDSTTSERCSDTKVDDERSPVPASESDSDSDIDSFDYFSPMILSDIDKEEEEFPESNQIG